MVVAHPAELRVGGVLDRDEGVVGVRQSPQYLVELALSGNLLAALGVLNDENHGQGQRGNQRLEDRLQSGGEAQDETKDDPDSVDDDDGHRQQRPGGDAVDLVQNAAAGSSEAVGLGFALRVGVGVAHHPSMGEVLVGRRPCCDAVTHVTVGCQAENRAPRQQRAGAAWVEATRLAARYFAVGSRFAQLTDRQPFADRVVHCRLPSCLRGAQLGEYLGRDLP